jgi:hypothetical protein
MRKQWMMLAAGLAVLIWTTGAYAGCWCGNGYSDPSTNFVEAQVWPGDNGATTWMNFIYTTDGSDPFTSPTAVTQPGTFYQFVGNNDWYQAWLTANSGDVVKWFAEAQSADLTVCNSDMYQFVSGYTPPTYPNLVGDCESELGVGADSMMSDPDLDGIFSVTLTATGDFGGGGGGGYQVVGVSGQWSPQYPGDSNIPVSFVTGEQVTFFLDTNAVPGWYPETHAVYDSKLVSQAHTWAVVGDWQGWDPANPETQMQPIGGGLYEYVHHFPPEMVGWHEFKCAADGGWNLQCGAKGYGSNSNTVWFEVTGDQCTGFWINPLDGRIHFFPVIPSGTESQSWGSIKSMYKN